MKTGLCSPQYHIIFDNQFATVPYLCKKQPPPNWQDLFHHHCKNILNDEPEITSIISFSPEWTTNGDIAYPQSANNISLPEGATESEGVILEPEGAPNATNNNIRDPAMSKHDATASLQLSEDDPATTHNNATASLPLPEDDPALAQNDATALLQLPH
jgi:hypothetical protein